jgi:hypothetical protein
MIHGRLLEEFQTRFLPSEAKKTGLEFFAVAHQTDPRKNLLPALQGGGDK